MVDPIESPPTKIPASLMPHRPYIGRGRGLGRVGFADTAPPSQAPPWSGEQNRVTSTHNCRNGCRKPSIFRNQKANSVLFRTAVNLAESCVAPGPESGRQAAGCWFRDSGSGNQEPQIGKQCSVPARAQVLVPRSRHLSPAARPPDAGEPVPSQNPEPSHDIRNPDSGDVRLAFQPVQPERRGRPWPELDCWGLGCRLLDTE